jgi:hypothetical protein
MSNFKEFHEHLTQAIEEAIESTEKNFPTIPEKQYQEFLMTYLHDWMKNTEAIPPFTLLMALLLLLY